MQLSQENREFGSFVAKSSLDLPDWTTATDATLNRESLTQLFDNQIPTIRIKEFASADECGCLESVLADSSFGIYEQVDPPILKLGPAQYEAGEMAEGGKEYYFGKVSEAEKKRDAIYGIANFDPIVRLISMLKKVSGKSVSIANDSNWGHFFSGTIRQINNSAKMHADFGQLNGRGWAIEHVTGQLAANLFVTKPDEGGHTTVYNRPWVAPDEESGKIPNCYSYHKGLVQGAQYKVITPARGDLVLFNSRNYHEVEQSAGKRFTVSTFIGRLSDGDMILWS